MRKIVFYLSILSLFLTGCSQFSKKTSTVDTIYESYYRATFENTKYVKATNYTVSGELTKLPDNTYRYYIVIDQPQVAMYNIVVFALDDYVEFGQSNKMMASVGIYESSKYNMVPNQVNNESNFVKGVVLSGDSSKDRIDLRLMVEYKDRSGENTYRDYLHYELSSDGLVPYDEVNQ